MQEQGSKSDRRGLWGVLTRSRAAPESQPPTEAASAKAGFASLFGDTSAAPSPPDPFAAAPPPAAPPPAAQAPLRVAPAAFLTPTDLQATAHEPARVLAIGSCFLQNLLAGQAASEAGLDFDLLLVTHIREIPALPPAPIGEYACQLIQIPLRFVMGDGVFSHLDYTDIASYRTAFEKCCQLLQLNVERRMKWNLETGLPTFVMNFPAPQFSGMGRFFPRFDLRNIEYFVMMLNQELERLVAGYRSAYILDVDRIAASLGRRYTQDDSFTVFGHGATIGPGLSAENRIETLGPLGDYYDLTPGEPFRHAIAAELRAMLRTLRQIDSVKLVVVDLDDTLWNGVSGDSADVGGHMVEGWPIGFVESLRYAAKRGILLAIISKNDETRIRDIWHGIFHGRLNLEDFATVRINWRPKVENMAEILAGINLLPRNVVFIDDNPVERAQMQKAFPAMRILGGNPFHLRRIMLLAPEMQTVSVTQESAERNAMVQSQMTREEDRVTLSFDEFARQQDVKVKILRIAHHGHVRFTRALELINKTNQFNTTGKRWTDQECDAFFVAGGVMVAYRVEDRYTTYGLVGVVMLRGSAIEQWVMSCRVIGLGVEQAVMHELVAEARQQGATTLSAMLEETTINQPCHELFRNAGFVRDGDVWRLGAETIPPRPQHITIGGKATG